MAKIARKTAIPFASGAGATQIGQFGSFAQTGTPAYSMDPAVIQSLAAWTDGWYNAVIGGNSPCIQDVNSVDFVYGYQLAYLMQEGIAEWDSGTTYYKGSLVNAAGIVYLSITDTNLNNAVTSVANWRLLNAPNALAINPAVTSTYQILFTDNNRLFEVNTANGVCAFTNPVLANISAGFEFTIKDVGGVALINQPTLAQNASELIENLGATFLMKKNYGIWTFVYDGTNFWLT